MTDITKELLKYRSCVRELWNNHFKMNNQEFEAESTYEFYTQIRATIFTSVISIHLFQKILETDELGYYKEIEVKPNIGPTGFKAMYAKVVNDEYIWDFIQLTSDKNTFKFYDFFDWSIDQTMDCQYAEVHLTASEEFPELVGSDFLLDASNVKYFKLEK